MSFEFILKKVATYQLCVEATTGMDIGFPEGDETVAGFRMEEDSPGKIMKLRDFLKEVEAKHGDICLMEAACHAIEPGVQKDWVTGCFFFIKHFSQQWIEP